VKFSPKNKGIYNPGLDCFLNSSLQALFSIPEFKSYFVDEIAVFGPLSQLENSSNSDTSNYKFTRHFKSL